eukprot:4816688-Alexandrium_andersonii.AAC.2
MANRASGSASSARAHSAIRPCLGRGWGDGKGLAALGLQARATAGARAAWSLHSASKPAAPAADATEPA